MILLFFLWACQTPPKTDTFRWSGYVLQRPNLGADLSIWESGNVSLMTQSGTPIVEAERPYESSLAYYVFDVPKEHAGEAISLRLSGAGMDNMLWRGQLPEQGPASWLNGGLFLHSQLYNHIFFNALGLQDTTVLAESTVCHLWGEPLIPEEWADATFTLIDGDGMEIPVQGYSLDEEGYWVTDITERMELFLAFDLAPGEVTMEVTLPDGRSAHFDYPAESGDLLSAVFATLPEPLP